MRLASFAATLIRPPLPAVAADAIHPGHAAAVSPLEQRPNEDTAPEPQLSIEEFVHLARLAGAL